MPHIGVLWTVALKTTENESETKKVRQRKLEAMAGMVIFDCGQIALDSGILHGISHCNREIN